MKVLLSHNFYGSLSPSGENVVFRSEEKMLINHGIKIERVIRHSDEIRAKGMLGLLKGAFSVLWNPFSKKEVLQKTLFFKPDVFHAHNTFPLLSPSVFYAASKTSGTILTLHNYRLFCPAAIPMRNGRICTQCIDRKTVWPSIRFGCYRSSRIATLPLALSVAAHRWLGTWQKKVDAFIVLSEFQKKLMIKAGLPPDKVFVKPNFHNDSPNIISWDKREHYVIYVGRLSEEKGLRTLLKAWGQWGSEAPELRVIGDGPLRDTLKIAAKGLPIRFFGHLSAKETQIQISNARLLILPSESFETFGLVAIEAFSFGTPVAVSNLGPLPEIVEDGKSGVVFNAADAGHLLERVRNAWKNQDALKKMGDRARLEFELKYTEELNFKRLIKIYQLAIINSKRRDFS